MIKKSTSFLDKQGKEEYRKSLHHQHRQRMKELFRQTDLKGFSEHNILELLLFYAIPRKNTNETAHMLLNEFGSFSAVLDASIESLKRIDGVGIETATFLKLIPAVFSAYQASKTAAKPVILNSESAKKYLSHYFTAATYEKLVVVYIDGKGRVLNECEFYQKCSKMVHVDMVTILQTAVAVKAEGIILAHNHVTDFAVPSSEDIHVTEQLAKLCEPLKIYLCEHLIFAENDVCMFSKNKKIKAKYLVF